MEVFLFDCQGGKNTKPDRMSQSAENGRILNQIILTVEITIKCPFEVQLFSFVIAFTSTRWNVLEGCRVCQRHHPIPSGLPKVPQP